MISGIIMASGFSSRMGQNKLLMEIGGESILERVIKACKDSLLDEIILVYRQDEIKKLGEKFGLITVYNSDAEKGQSSAVIHGVKSSRNGNGFMFFVGDQPYLDSGVINNLIQEYKKSQNMIVAPYYNHKLGMPIIFPPIFKDALLKVEGDKGGRQIIKDYPDLVKKIFYKDELKGIDIDTFEDYTKISH